MAFWRDTLLPASFRGVPFYVEDSDLTFGRRNQLNEYPLRDTPNSQDLGRKAREYNFNAYVIGDLYPIQRQALIAVIELNKTPGILIHPQYGILRVTPKPCKVAWTNREGGMERFELSFTETGNNSFPDILQDTQALIQAGIGIAASAIVDGFNTGFSTDGAPHYIKMAATGLAMQAGSAIFSATQSGGVLTDEYSSYSDTVESFNNNIGSLIEPSDYSNALSPLILDLNTIYEDPKDAYKAQKSLTEFGVDFLAVPQTTSNRKLEASNQAAFIGLMKNTAIVGMADAISNMEFTSRQDALTIRNEFSDIVYDSLIDLADNLQTTEYNALTQVLSSVINDIDERGSKLADTVTIKTKDSVPAIVFSYNYYGTSDKIQEVVDRNHIRNPLFLPPYSEIEILQ